MLKIIELSREEFCNKNNSLRDISLPVDDFGEEFQIELDQVIETFYNSSIAVGLSAPQVGIKKRFAVVNISKNRIQEDIILVNPQIISLTGETESKYESCLSLPNLKGKVERFNNLNIVFQDRGGISQKLEAKGFLARVILHELDHLDGILFVDRMEDTKLLESTN